MPNLVFESITDYSCEGEFGIIRAFALDVPIIILTNDAHSLSSSPPTIDFPRERKPHSVPSLHVVQESQQISVSAPCLLFDNVVGMDNKAHQTILPHNQFYLRLPQVQ
jgi:hypothetical protein